MSPASRRARGWGWQLLRRLWKNTAGALRQIICARAARACELYCRWPTARAPRAPSSRAQVNIGENVYDRFKNTGGGRGGGYPRAAERDSLRGRLRGGDCGGREPSALLARGAGSRSGAVGYLDARYGWHYVAA